MIVRVLLQQSLELGFQTLSLPSFYSLEQPIDSLVEIGPDFGYDRFFGGIFRCSFHRRCFSRQTALLVFFSAATRAGIVSSGGLHAGVFIRTERAWQAQHRRNRRNPRSD